MLNLNESIVTRRNAYPVELYRIGVKDSSPFTIHGAFYVPLADGSGRWFVMAWTTDGLMTPGEQSDLDLVNPSEPAPPPSSVQAPVASLPPLALAPWEVA